MHHKLFPVFLKSTLSYRVPIAPSYPHWFSKMSICSLFLQDLFSVLIGPVYLFSVLIGPVYMFSVLIGPVLRLLENVCQLRGEWWRC